MRNEVDSLGRFVIPVKFRRMLNINHGDELDVTCQKGALVIKKAGQGCVFCDGTEDLFFFEERAVCRECLKKLTEKHW
ncbi:MAG: AbrB family transcriptional regulator [Ruminococcaceae bacterium]|nr:AbrB family transcriptional regulator [Oscillospiraceae bacterium]